MYSKKITNHANQTHFYYIRHLMRKLGRGNFRKDFWDCYQGLVSLTAVFWMSRNAPPLLGERCVTSKKRLRGRLTRYGQWLTGTSPVMTKVKLKWRSGSKIIKILLDSVAFVEHIVSDPRNCYNCPTVCVD